MKIQNTATHSLPSAAKTTRKSGLRVKTTVKAGIRSTVGCSTC